MNPDPAIHHIPSGFNRLAAKIAGTSVATHKVVSLFSGCGGMDLGFVGGFRFAGRYYDKMTFDIVWANDINAAAAKTYEANIKHSINVGDIEDVLATLPKSTDVLIGGFPCQDVSINGLHKNEEGVRTILYRQMIEAIQRTKPSVFVAENVKGLLQAHGRAFFDQMLAEFEALSPGYNINYKLYLAADYGVPQMRERVFIIGVKGKRRAEFLHPDPSSFRMTAREALRDLEIAPENKAAGHIWSKAAMSPDQGSRKLNGDKPATTIRAEHHGNIQWHYSLGRRISLREAARLQSFPDEFSFHGGMRQAERQIGNAVPPVLAWHIAKAVREHLDAD